MGNHLLSRTGKALLCIRNAIPWIVLSSPLCSSSLIQVRKSETADKVTDIKMSCLPISFPKHPASHQTASDLEVLKTTLLILKYSYVSISTTYHQQLQKQFSDFVAIIPQHAHPCDWLLFAFSQDKAWRDLHVSPLSHYYWPSHSSSFSLVSMLCFTQAPWVFLRGNILICIYENLLFFLIPHILVP